MYQKIILIGRVGHKKMSVTKNAHKPVVQYSLATTKSTQDKSGSWVEHTEWHRLVSFSKCAEHVNSKLEPGDLIQVEGEVRARSWQDSQGNNRYITEIVVFDFPKKLPKFFSKDIQSDGHRTPQPRQQLESQDFSMQGPSFDDDVPF